ncbi:DUF5753 domain-containing protein [Actinomadura rupiterrae]|uniref:DUF5753 domain-containing protein n=1 Tax=Actinomadura rupiterrae TaxID=559627 RepID=UPI0020A27679|nr:DUF5753 domain-containing protein [Actinomadura rupiterrae]MCP2335908.1 DNA-binding XRE family transcriptional regulator [Actinomadura rupiterrae]
MAHDPSLSQDALAKELYLTRGTIQAVEACSQAPDMGLAIALDGFFGTGELFQGLVHHMQREHLSEWLQEYLSLEAEALQVRTVHSYVIPGLFQTVDYMRALMKDARHPDIEKGIAQRVARQAIVTREENPPLFWVVLDEAVLLRLVGGRAVMHAQLGHLLDLMELPNVSIQVVEMSAGEYGQVGSFIHLDLPGRQVAYTEAAAGGRLLQEPREVSELHVWHDRIRLKALNEKATRDLIIRRRESVT